jgi:hypothetical protein
MSNTTIVTTVCVCAASATSTSQEDKDYRDIIVLNLVHLVTIVIKFTHVIQLGQLPYFTTPLCHSHTS